MSGPSMRQLRSWHRRLSNAHSKACSVAKEAKEVLGPDDAVIIMDPIIELNAALHDIEGRMEQRATQQKDRSNGAR